MPLPESRNPPPPHDSSAVYATLVFVVVVFLVPCIGTADQLARAVGLPEVFLSDGEGGGVIQGSASEGTLVGLLAARTRALTCMRRMSPGVSDHELMARMTIYTSDQVSPPASVASLLSCIGFDCFT